MLYQSDVLTLNDNKKYVVAFSTEYNQNNYVYLIEKDDYTNAMFYKYEDSSLEKVNDSNTIQELLKMYLQEK